MENLEERLHLLEEENLRLRAGIEELSILNEIATAINSTTSLNRIIDLMVHKCVKHLCVEQGVVLLLDKPDQSEAMKTMVRRVDQSAEFLPYRLDGQLIGWMLKEKKPLLINDLASDRRISAPAKQKFPVRSLLAAPLMLKNRMIGVISLFNKKSSAEFTAADQRLLAIIASQSAQIIENARLYEEEQALFRIQEEMRLARDIQMNLQPKETPSLKGYDIAGLSIPATEVGGDYLDFIRIDDQRLALCMGDVSGKGIPAAMLMSNLQATLRAQTVPDVSPSTCIRRSNTLLFNSTDLNKYATLFYGILDAGDHRLTYTNAGHDIPVILRGDKQFRLGAGGIVLGFLNDFEYTEEEIALQSGDLLVLYTDGITEAMNAGEREFGVPALMKIVEENRGLSAAQLIDIIVEHVLLHAGGVPQSDDMTLMVIRKE